MKNVYKFNGGSFILTRDRDGSGDSGPMLNAVEHDETGVRTVPNEIRIGSAVQVGSNSARSYSTQDWWLTTVITEFINVDENAGLYQFSTGNSTYTLMVR